MKEMGPFSEIFANLESMNKAVSNALVESAKVCSICCFCSYIVPFVKPLKLNWFMTIGTYCSSF